MPPDPALAFLDSLIEDYADEWLTKAMFHYRWTHETDARSAGPLLAFRQSSTLSDAEGRRIAAAPTQRQVDRLHVEGSNATTAETIESSFTRLVDFLDPSELVGQSDGAEPEGLLLQHVPDPARQPVDSSLARRMTALAQITSSRLGYRSPRSEMRPRRSFPPVEHC